MAENDNDVSDVAQKIIATITRHGDRIFQRLHRKANKLAAYNRLLCELPSTNVGESADYRTRYKGFYQVRFRPEQWLTDYFLLLQNKKTNQKVTFAEVIHELYALTRRVEVSFSSKLVATIRPELPVYDAELRRHMSVTVPPPNVPPADRIGRWIPQYDRMTSVANCVTKAPEFLRHRKRFDVEFPEYKHFSSTKKLDLMLWQCRENNHPDGGEAA